MGDGGLVLVVVVVVVYCENGMCFLVLSMVFGLDVCSVVQNVELIVSQYLQLVYSWLVNLIEMLVEVLWENQVLGMFKGCMEFGLCVLCNCSIVYYFGDVSVNDWFNQCMECIEFMLFVLVIVVEYVEGCYIGWCEDQVVVDYMIMIYDCYVDFCECCLVVVYVDGIVWLQIIWLQVDLFMYVLLYVWYVCSGQLVLINIFFNCYEELIVCVLQDVFGVLEDGMVDLVVLGEFLLVWCKGENVFVRVCFE